MKDHTHIRNEEATKRLIEPDGSCHERIMSGLVERLPQSLLGGCLRDAAGWQQFIICDEQTHRTQQRSQYEANDPPVHRTE
ncbi:MAG: hypothetical protein ACKO2W_09540, partial [Vulcanococcus sp.]